MADTGEQAPGEVTVRRGWIRWMNRTLWVCGVVFVLILGLLVYFHEAIIDSIYKNVAYITDGEMPVTVTSYPSGPEVAGILGGSGEGLNCSLPPLADLFFEDGNPGTGPGSGLRHLVRQKFRQACVFHDLCYRHGLATYGYTQNDCDRILQEHAHRLCEYLPKGKKTGDQCQLDAKKVLAGVSLGGFGSYRGWDRSTFFEFDAHPLRSQRFYVSRVVDHPFKTADPEKYKDESQQVILTFESKRAEVKVRCANCGQHNILRSASDVSPELASAGMTARPAPLIGRSLDLDGIRNIWLPPWRDHAAPHLLTDAAGKQWIVWTSRSESQNTMVCTVIADATRLLTYTLPQSNACSPDAKSSLRLAEFDVLSSAPQPGMSPESVVVTTGLTRQLRDTTTLDLCRWPHTPAARTKTRDCARLETAPGQGVPDLGAFQSFPIVKTDRHIYVSRAITDDAALRHRVTLRDRVFGDWHSSKGRFLILSNPYDAGGAAPDARIQRVTSVPFDISDQYDPMMPLSRAMADNNKLLSLVAKGERVEIFFIDAARDWPVPAPVAIRMNNAELMLHKSWASRPALIVETNEQGAIKSQLVFSRSLLAPADQKTEVVLFEVLLMERGLTEPAEKPYEVSASAVCKITYSIRSVRENLPCRRTFSADRLMRSSPGAMLQGSQMLVGRFNREGQLALALSDTCFPGDPIILSRREPCTFMASQKPPPPIAAKRAPPNNQRTVECTRSKGPAGIGRRMNAGELLALFK
jgi:hypothetical protein